MKKRIFNVLLLSALIVAIAASGAFAAIGKFSVKLSEDKLNDGKLSWSNNAATINLSDNIHISFDATYVSGSQTITQNNLLSWTVGGTFAQFGLTSGDSSENGLSIKGQARKVGKATITLNVQSKDTPSTKSSQVVYTLNIKNPADNKIKMYWISGDKKAGTSSGNATLVTVSNDKNNKLYSRASLSANLGLSSKDDSNLLTFYVEGLSQDSKLKVKKVSITPSTSGLTATMSTDSTAGKNWQVGRLGISIVGSVDKEQKLTEKQEYTVEIIATAAGEASDGISAGDAKGYFKFEVYPKIKINTTKTFEVPWGKEVTYPPSLNLKDKTKVSWDITKPSSSNANFDSADLKAFGLILGKNGTEATVGDLNIKGTWTLPYSGDLKLDPTSSDIEKTVHIVVSDDSGISSADIVFKFKAVKPEFSDKSALEGTTGWTSQLVYGESIDTTTMDSSAIKVKGPGSMDFTVSDLPEGISWDKVVHSWDEGMYITLNGKPTQIVKGSAARITVKNGAGTATLKPKFTVTLDGDLSTNSTREGFGLPTGDFAKDAFISSDAFDMSDRSRSFDIVISVEPGPITWKATNLPKGITLSWDKNKGANATVAKLIGKFSKAGTYNYTITATNKALEKTVTLGETIIVHEKPTISTTKLPDITAGKAYTAKIATKNATNWDIKFSADNSSSWVADGYGANTDAQNADSYASQLSFDKATGKFVGSIDKIPAGGIIVIHVSVDNPAGAASADYTVNVKGIAPKVTTKSIGTMTGGSLVEIEASGTRPVDISAYIDASSAKKFFDASTQINITTSEDGAPSSIEDQTTRTGFYFIPDLDDNGNGLGTGKLYFLADAKQAYKNLPITFAATNSANATKPATKKLNVTVTGNDPVWYAASGDDTAEDSYTPQTKDTEIVVYNKAGEALGVEDDSESRTGYRFYVSGDRPLTVKFAGAKNGLTVTSADREDAHDGKVYTVAGTPTVNKETKTTITLTATNPSTGVKNTLKLTVNGTTPPEISTKETALKKEVELGKAISIKPAAKGTKNSDGKYTWKLFEANDDFDEENVEAADNNVTEPIAGLTFDGTTGAITGTPTAVTLSDDDPTAYDTKKFYLYALNGVGNSSAKTVEIGVKGKKPAIKTRTLNYTVVDPDFASEGQYLESNFSETDLASSNTNVVFEAASDTEAAKLDKMNIALTEADDDNKNIGLFDVGTVEGFEGLQAAKGTSVKFKADNYGSNATGNVKFVIEDPNLTEIQGPTTTATGDTAAPTELTAGTDKVTQDYFFTLPDNEVTGDTKIKWTLDTKPQRITAKIKKDPNNQKDARGERTARVTITVPKNFRYLSEGELAPLTTSFTVKAQNTSRKSKPSVTTEVELTINSVGQNGDLPEDVAALPETAVETEAEAEAEAEVNGEEAGGTITFGATRTVDGLSAAERAAIEEAGYIIAAVLPETTVDISGQYDIELELIEAAPEGAELAYFAFPRDAEATEDDAIVDFFDEDGAETEVVPEGRKIVASPWFTAEKTYAPVIAVKADSAAGAKDDAENLEAGDVVTESALETAAE